MDIQRTGPSTGMPTRTQQSDVMKCAYASHGDTKHVLLFSEDPYECFEMGAQAFDLAERLQTPVFMMTDLDIGMNQRLCNPLAWDDARRYDRGKLMTGKNLEAGLGFRPMLQRARDGLPQPARSGNRPAHAAPLHRGRTAKTALALSHAS